ncbi:DUF6409 family protein [Streptomyces sp. NPDC051561]|uniref:DUF6409 family protein n=1 Tax=Streptomyces sp. NPDC051561 TaxID=3365658 RepID=UPI003795501B
MTTTQTATASTVEAFPTGTLVTVGPWFQGHQLDPRAAIVVGPWGAEGNGTVLVWFWTLGAPEPGETVQAMFPSELTPLDDTLTTMALAPFGDIVRFVRIGWFIGDDGDALRAEISAALSARIGRDGTGRARWVLSAVCGDH